MGNQPLGHDLSIQNISMVFTRYGFPRLCRRFISPYLFHVSIAFNINLYKIFMRIYYNCTIILYETELNFLLTYLLICNHSCNTLFS